MQGIQELLNIKSYNKDLKKRCLRNWNGKESSYEINQFFSYTSAPWTQHIHVDG